jgi:hypothetical protein
LWFTTPAIPVPITASDRPSRPISNRFTGGQTSGAPALICVITPDHVSGVTVPVRPQ